MVASPVANAPPVFAPAAGQVVHEGAPIAASEEAQRTGDFVVHRFSGSFKKNPLTLTQKVIESSATAIVLEMTLEDGKTKRTLRARFERSRGARPDPSRVWLIDPKGERAGSLADYEALMSETMLAADDNEGVIEAAEVSAKVGTKTMQCKRTTYRVIVNKKRATMSTLSSDAFPWGDVGGEIKTDDGKLLYRVEVIGAGHEPAPLAAAR
jgi:hypothetical protein